MEYRHHDSWQESSELAQHDRRPPTVGIALQASCRETKHPRMVPRDIRRCEKSPSAHRLFDTNVAH